MFSLAEQFERAVELSLGFPYASHCDAPTIAVLGQACELAEFPALEQMLCGGLQVILLTVQLAHAHMHICRSTQHKPAVRHRKLQPLLVGAHSLTQTTLCNADIREGKSTADCISNVPRSLEPFYTLWIDTARFLEIPVCPGYKCQQGCCRSSVEVVFLGGEFERLLGESHSGMHIA